MCVLHMFVGSCCMQVGPLGVCLLGARLDGVIRVIGVQLRVNVLITWDSVQLIMSQWFVS